jgi:hypothetical protein
MNLQRGVFCLLLLFAMEAKAQTKILQATKIQQGIKLDGLLDDTAWAHAATATDFIMNYPQFGIPSTEKTIVKILYDDDAIYVGAYLYDSDPKGIRKQLTARDREGRADADNFSVTFDTYLDKQNAYQFIVTTANVQSDVRMSQGGAANCNGDGCPNDRNWDAVWDSKTRIVADGWVVEMKIPYFSLRFGKKELQNWGLQFNRFIRRKNENSFWSPVDPNVSGFINQFGELRGLQNLQPPLRLSFLPYIGAGINNTPLSDGSSKNTFLKSGGMDVKYGINESFTLDMTLVPDFSQVVSDNLIRNLSPFEQQLNENRPFFTEGTDLFNKAGLFYTRRIGSAPSGFGNVIDSYGSNANYSILENPSTTQLINATKVSGRTNKNLGIGFFNAVTATTEASVKDNVTGKTFTVETAPLTNFNVLVLDQAFANRSSLTFTNTNVLRNGNARDGNVASVDLSLFDKANIYNLTSGIQWSHVTGVPNANGVRANLGFQKVSGSLQWGANVDMLDKNFDPNDLGILFQNNQINTIAELKYFQFKPKASWLINYNAKFQYKHNLRYQDFAYQDIELNSSLFLLFKNFWDINFYYETKPKDFNDFFEPRKEGFALKRYAYHFGGINFSTDSRKKFFTRMFWGFGMNNFNGSDFKIAELFFRYRFSDRFSLELNHEQQYDYYQQGYAFEDTTVNGKSVPLMAQRRTLQITNTIGGIYNFTPRMNFTFRMRHYWSSVKVEQNFLLDSEGYPAPVRLRTGNDENFNLFNIDCFFTWDFLLGSRLTVAYKRALTDGFSLNGLQNEGYFNNFSKIVQKPQASELSFRIVWFLDYLHLKKGKFKV